MQGVANMVSCSGLATWNWWIPAPTRIIRIGQSIMLCLLLQIIVRWREAPLAHRQKNPIARPAHVNRSHAVVLLCLTVTCSESHVKFFQMCKAVTPSAVPSPHQGCLIAYSAQRISTNPRSSSLRWEMMRSQGFSSSFYVSFHVCE